MKSPLQWIIANVENIVLSTLFVIVVYSVYRFSVRQITRLREQDRLDESASFVLRRIFGWGSILIVVVFVIAQFGIRIDLIAGLLVIAGGTVMGFASMSTLGNAIAGLILMISKPFGIGDRLFFNDQFADVEAIDLIYTRMRTTDNILVSVPNQELIQSEIDNYGKERTVRRQHSITVGYDTTASQVEKALLESANKIEGVLKEPEPYVWVTDLKEYSVEYTLLAFVNEVRRIQEIDSQLRRTILETCGENDIDLTTPTLIRSVK